MSIEKCHLARLLYGLRSAGVQNYGMSLTVAERTGYSQAMVNKVLNGHAAMTDRFVTAVCSQFGISKEWVESGREPVLDALPEGEDVLSFAERIFTGKLFSVALTRGKGVLQVQFKNGSQLQILSNGTFAARFQDVGEFEKLPLATVKMFSERDSGPLDVSLLSIGFSLVLMDGVQQKLLEKFGDLEKVAEEYSRLKHEGAFEGTRRGHMALNWIFNFFRALKAIADVAAAQTFMQNSRSVIASGAGDSVFMDDVAIREAIAVMKQLSEPERWRAVAALKEMLQVSH